MDLSQVFPWKSYGTMTTTVIESCHVSGSDKEGVARGQCAWVERSLPVSTWKKGLFV